MSKPQKDTLPRQQVPRRTAEINVKQRYLEAYKKYVSSQFTYNSHCLLRKLCQNGEKQPNLYNVPLYKIMIEITKIMMMNQLELLFFGATVQQMGWKKVQEPCLNDYISDVTDITPKIQGKGDFVKKLQLSLLLIAYIVKIYLNEESTLYDFKIRDLAKNNFDKMYQEWVMKVQNHFKFSPKHMNKLFKQFDKAKRSSIKQEIIDYNLHVGQLCKQDRYDDNDLYNNNIQQRPINHGKDHKENHREEEYQYRVSRDKRKVQGLPVHQDEDLAPPPLQGRSFSARSNVSGLGKKESLHQLFNEGQLKPYRGLSQLDQDFMNGGL